MLEMFNEDLEYIYVNDILLEDRTFKNSIVNERKLKTAQRLLHKYTMALIANEKELSNKLRISMRFEDFPDGKAYYDEFEKRIAKGTAKLRKDIKKHQTDVDELTAKYRTASNLEVPKAPPTLSDDISNLTDTSNINPNRGVITPMGHNYKTFSAFSPDGKELYNTIRERGNVGEVFELYKQEMDKFSSIKPTELSKIMKTAISMGYKLGNNIYFWLDEMSPKLAKDVNAYDGFGLSHKNYMDSNHAYYRNIYNQYLNKYDGNVDKAIRMTKLYRKKRQAESKMEQTLNEK